MGGSLYLPYVGFFTYGFWEEKNHTYGIWKFSCMSARNLTSTVEKFEIGSIPRIFSKKIGNQYPCSPWWCWIFSRFFEEVSLKLYQNRHAVIPGLVIWNSTLVLFSQMIRRHDSQIQEVSGIGKRQSVYESSGTELSIWVVRLMEQQADRPVHELLGERIGARTIQGETPRLLWKGDDNKRDGWVHKRLWLWGAIWLELVLKLIFAN